VAPRQGTDIRRGASLSRAWTPRRASGLRDELAEELGKLDLPTLLVTHAFDDASVLAGAFRARLQVSSRFRPSAPIARHVVLDFPPSLDAGRPLSP